ncbi:MAG TPA: SpoIIE family protein phosphatase [Bacteroidia bacterium]|nr:SpoIIE family protein phosphatase [Bacteroidia bacterium]
MSAYFSRIIAVVFGCTSAFFSNAQLLNTDSCLQVLKTSREDTAKVELLSKIAWNISYQNLQKGLNYAEQSIALAKKLNSEIQYARVYHVAGAIYADMSEQGKAIDFFLEGLKYAKKYKQNDVMGFIYNSLGNFYNKRNDLRKAISLYLQSVEAHKTSGSDKYTYTPYNNLGGIYLKLKNTDSALYYVDLCVQYSKKSNDKYRIANNYIVLAEIYSETKNIKGLDYASKAVELSRSLNDKYTLSHALIHQGYALYLHHQPEPAISVLEESSRLAKEIGDITTLQSCALILSDIYSEKNDYKNALLYFKQYKTFEDSIINNENIQQMRTAEAKYENEKKQKEIELLAEREKLSEAKREQEKLYLYFAIAGIAGLAVLAIVLIKNNRTKQRTNKELASFNEEVKRQKELVEDKNKEITDSINYARRIQHSILTSHAYFEKHTREFFILFRPKDIVSGDFYWAMQNNDQFLVMTADCTGHGVPGAMMSMMGINFLNEIVKEKNVSDPAAILNQLRKEITNALNPEGSLVETKDGLDCSLCCFDFKKMKLTYANANNRFYIIRNNTLIISDVNKMPVGAGHNADQLFTSFSLELKKEDLVVTFTDGYADQFGGPKGKKFKYKALEELLLTQAHQPIEIIQKNLNEVIDKWRGPLEQVDDICIVGIKI